jgi:hypothetical protein
LDFHGEVDALPLSAILEPDELRRARLIKIDIEGGEWSAISGISAFLPDLPPAIEWVIELHPAQLRALGRSGDDIVNLFASAGYHPYHLQNYALPVDCIAPLQPVRPVRLERVIDEEMLVVFSKIDAEFL